MNYPAYPEPAQSNVFPPNTNRKAPVPTLLSLAEDFQALGLYVVPKRTGEKIAHWKFWMKKENHVPLEPAHDNLLQYLSRNDTDGLILAVGKSQGGRLVVLDIDPAGVHMHGSSTYRDVQELSPTGYVVATPGNGLHLYYLLPEGVPQLKPTTHVHWDNLDIRAKNSLIGLPGSYQQYLGERAEKKGVQSGHIGVYRRLHEDPFSDYSHIPTMSDALYQLLWAAQNPVRTTTPSTVGASNYEHTPEALARIEAHMKRPLAERERLVVELIGYVLSDWRNKNYDQWMQFWMSAYHGSDGSRVVRDVIAQHDGLWAGRKASEVEEFIAKWDNHEPNPEGYTISSLMYLARKNGWLQSTGLEIPRERVIEIDVKFIQEWTAAQKELPTRVLVQSQTGSGKTYNIKFLYDKLGTPKTVIFVPTTKLAIELANTLKNEHKMPVTLYINPKNGKTLPSEDLVKAQVLVTTLQTFGAKVHKHIPMENYGLVYFEESDQLFQQFGRGGGGSYGSHVKDDEARKGFAVIRDAFAHSGNVWCVDATMTQVTYFVADQTREDHPLTVVRNVQVATKPTVYLLNSRGEAYQKVLHSLLAKKSVVVAADTAQAAEEVVNTMEAIGVLTNKKVLLITSHTERNPDVLQFMDDVNKWAPTYDLLVYNSVMASGVSITSHTPDVTVQICNYLTPRVNLQLLNRYRSQSEVYVFYQNTENLYGETDLTILTEAYRRAGLEATLVNMPLAERVPDAVVRARVAAMSIGDETLQRRSVVSFYTGLLERDGREVIETDPVPEDKLIERSVKAVRVIRKELAEELKSTWIETRPIDRDHPADTDMTEMEIAQGEIHGLINSILRGNIPGDVDPKEIYETAIQFKPTLNALTAFVQQGETLRLAESYLADEGRSIVTLANHITLIQVITTVHVMYQSIHDRLTQDDVADRAGMFMRLLEAQKDNYDAVINRGNQKWDEVYNRSDTDYDRALDFCKILLARIGLKQRAKRDQMHDGVQTYVYSIENAEQAVAFLNWRYQDEAPKLEFSDSPIRKLIEARGSHIKMFQAMNADQQKQVMRILNDEKTTSFTVAVETVLMGDQF